MPYNLLSKRETSTLHLPDLKFFLFCQETYNVNRGVYNTIDNWLYEYGNTNIYRRRQTIIEFMEYLMKTNDLTQKHKAIRFGNGGLSKSLHEFMLEKEYTIR